MNANANATELKPHPDESVGPLERGFTVLRALAATPGGRLRASELVRDTGLPRSTVDRVGATLGELGYVRVEGGGRDLVLSPGAARLGGAYLRASRVPALLTGLCEDLSAVLDESVSLAVPDGDAVRFVIQIKRRRALSVSFRVGDALPAECCAPGALFAQTWSVADFDRWRARLDGGPKHSAFPALPQHPMAANDPDVARVAERFARRIEASRRDGWSEDDQLIEQGLIAIAVPVHGADGSVVGALSAVSHTSRQNVETFRKTALPQLLQTAQAMTDRLADQLTDRQQDADTQATAATAATATATRPDQIVDPTTAAKERLGPEYLQSLARGINVLTALGEDPGSGLTLAEAATATGLPRATVRRSLLTAARQGYVATEAGHFRLLPRALELGYARLSRLSLGELAQPHLGEVVSAVHESASMAVLDGTDIRYVARAAAGRIMSVDITIGTRFPAFATSMGRVLLADLDSAARKHVLGSTALQPLTRHTVTDQRRLLAILTETARQGFALVDQELEEGLRSIAVPVRGAQGRAVGAINVSLHAARTSATEAQQNVLPVLRRAAQLIEEDLALLS
ncbi:IclR family transcriptional regulator domain-containing protein [Catenulispora pinisilvae]|uniref:IclR family transcriptional regulator domain-containing protein n=1 Tax=Catenulispora pinisilvae TaxID=2705253 RepID=UPI002B270FE2|nr:IclR family transcriptional regulator C-terminal domain-containing protein [Catenulispora pinisilvae]